MINIPDEYKRWGEGYHCPHCGLIISQQEAEMCASAWKGEKVDPAPDKELMAAGIPCPYYD
jgi:hypothetical protein